MRSFHVRLPLLAFMALGAQACYSAVRVDPSDIEPGSRLTVHLNDGGIEHLGRFSDQMTSEIPGELRSLTGDSLTVVSRLRQPSPAARDAERLRQALTFSLGHVREVTVPELSKGRTAGVVLAAVVLVGYVLGDVLNFGGVDTRTPDPPNPSPFWAR